MTLDVITSDLLSAARHGFFGRAGGASSGIYSGLNCGLGSNDQSGAVTLNRARVAKAIGVAPDNLHTLHQCHSTDVVVADGADWSTQPKADALVVGTPGIAIGVLTADCAPVLMLDAEARVAAAVHAGWRGALDGVLAEAVAAMEKIGAKRAAIRAAVGPTISQAAYEVGPEFLDRFMAEEAGYDRFFIPGAGDRLRFDLPGFVVARLREEGVDAGWTGHCTHQSPARFYSYRRATQTGEPDYGRMISAIVL